MTLSATQAKDTKAETEQGEQNGENKGRRESAK